MLRILISRQTGYPADTQALKTRLKKFLAEHQVSDAQVSLALVGERKMRELSKNYLGEDRGEHEVLSFPAIDPKQKDNFVSAHNLLPLGDIVICYPLARERARKKNKLVDEVLGELAEHGTLHLLGIHHEE